MIKQREVVPMPLKRVTKKLKPDGKFHIYLILYSFRNEKGKPAIKETMIGQSTCREGPMVPNKNYYKYFDLEDNLKLDVLEEIRSQYKSEKKTDGKSSKFKIKLSKNSTLEFYSIGIRTLLDSIMNNSQLMDSLKVSFPDKYNEISLISEYIMTKNSSMMHLESYQEDHLTRGNKLRGGDVSKFFESIDESSIQRFLESWLKANYDSNKDITAIDVTSISTYAKDITKSNFGYNRDKEALKQLNLGLLSSANKNLPLMYWVYEGSIPDKTKFKNMIYHSTEIGAERMTLVMDQGFTSRKNMEVIEKQNLSYVTPVANQTKGLQDILNACYEDMIRPCNLLSKFEHVYAIKFDGLRENTKMHVFYDLDKRDEFLKELPSRTERAELELSKLEKAFKPTKRLEKLHDIKVIGEDSVHVEYWLSDEKYNEAYKMSGFFALETNNSELTSDQVLASYKMRNVCEMHFDMFKNENNLKRLRVYNDERARGKIFCGFISLILKCLILNLKNKNKYTRKMSVTTILNQLDNIRICVNQTKKQIELGSLSKKQRLILEALGCPHTEEDLAKQLKNVYD